MVQVKTLFRIGSAYRYLIDIYSLIWYPKDIHIPMRADYAAHTKARNVANTHDSCHKSYQLHANSLALKVRNLNRQCARISLRSKFHKFTVKGSLHLHLQTQISFPAQAILAISFLHTPYSTKKKRKNLNLLPIICFVFIYPVSLPYSPATLSLSPMHLQSLTPIKTSWTLIE